MITVIQQSQAQLLTGYTYSAFYHYDFFLQILGKMADEILIL